jgi:predicted acyltransferase
MSHYLEDDLSSKKDWRPPKEDSSRAQQSESKAGTMNRLVSLDVFRGITIAGMVLVNDPGSWASIYWPLEHAKWHGWTPTDLIFPFFLFIVGVATALAFAKRKRGDGKDTYLYLKAAKRALIIFGLGLFLNGFPYFNFEQIRIPGVLQRIAVCYLVASIIFLSTKVRTQALIATSLLVIYWLLMTGVGAPGFAPGDLSKEGSLASFVDRAVFGKHVWAAAKVYDPEGLLSTIPAIATTLFGVLAGQWLTSARSQYEKVAGLFFAGMCGVVIGWAWNPFFPINKALWTSSYVVFTAGLALQLLAFCYWLVDIKSYRRWALPFIVFGVNAIALYVGSGLMARLLGTIRIQRSDASWVTLHDWIYEFFFTPWLSPVNASLAFAIDYVSIWLGLMWLLYWRKIYIKV